MAKIENLHQMIASVLQRQVEKDNLCLKYLNVC